MSHRVEPQVFSGQMGKVAGDETEVRLSAEIGMAFCWCPATVEPVLLGSPATEKDRGNDEVEHWVSLTEGFWLAKHPCNQGQWRTVMGKNPSHFDKGEPFPVDSVSWHACMEFCKRFDQQILAGWRITLPSEAQWEYACRAGAKESLPFAIGAGESLHGQLANHHAKYPYGSGFEWLYREATVEQGRFPPNRWGLHDMHGQLWEWCQDWLRDYGKGSKSRPLVDPIGPESGEERVLRGGAWSGDGERCRSASRSGLAPGSEFQLIGFRPVLVPSGEEDRRRSL